MVEMIIRQHEDDSINGPAAFDVVFEHFHPRLVRFLSKMLRGTTVDPDDVAQETMVKAWKKRDQFDPRYQFSTWVYTIARRTAADHLRKQSRNTYSDSDALYSVPQSESSPEQSLISNEATESVWNMAEQQLTTRQYSVLWLRYGEEMTIKEVAKTLSMTCVSVRVSLHRARATLQPHIERNRSSEASVGGLKS